MAPSRETLALRKQFEVQSQNFAAVLTELQQLTLQLDEQRASTQVQIDSACAASEARAQEMAQRAEQMEQRATDAERQKWRQSEEQVSRKGSKAACQKEAETQKFREHRNVEQQRAQRGKAQR